MADGSTTAEPEMQTGPPPQVRLMDLSLGLWNSQTVYVVAKLGICDLLADGPKTVDELASEVGAHAPSLARLLRAAAALEILQRVDDNTYALGPLGGSLRTGVPESIRWFAIMNGEEHYEAWGALLDSVRTGETAVERVFGKEYFTYLSEHPESGETFNRAMGDLARNAHIPAVMQFDFSPFSSVTDIAGGTGSMLSWILQTNPHLKGRLLDRAEVLDQAREVMAAMGVEDRCELVPGNYYESVPAGSDVYMMSLILHDLNDEQALTLLRNVAQAMSPGGLLIAVELVVPDDGRPDLAYFNDLNMLVLTGGKERTEKEFGELYEQAGLRLKQVVTSPTPMRLVLGEPA